MMSRLISMLLALLALMLVPSFVHAAKAMEEYPLFSRIEGFEFGSDSRESSFDSRKFRAGPKSSDSVEVEGRFLDLRYKLGKGMEAPGSAYIIGNLVAATEKVGGKVLYRTKSTATLNIRQGAKDIWVDVASAASGSWYYLRIIERGALKQEVKVNPVLDAIDKVGRATVYIHFDTASSRIKPESAAVVEDILSMLSQRPQLKVSIEGHTDSEGGAARNLKLSQERAAAVVAALIQGGISVDRLSSIGFGMSKPVADNGTEEGRALNRRVDIVRLDK